MNSNKEFKPNISVLNISVLNILLNMYCKSGSIDDACNVFDKVPQRNVVSWTTLIASKVMKYDLHGPHSEHRDEIINNLANCLTKCLREI